MYIEQNAEQIQRLPTLHLQLQRVQGVELSEAYPVWKTAAQAIFSSEKAKRDWLESEHRLFQLQRRIWEELTIIPADETPPAAFKGSLNDYSAEALFDWLDKRRNYLHKDWPRIWQNVVERLAFDARLIALAETWVYSVYSETQDIVSLKHILYAILHYHREHEDDKGALSDFLSDAFDPEFYLIFEFLRPARLFENVLLTLSADRELESTIKLLEFCVLELPKDGETVAIIDAAARRVAARVVDTKSLERLAAVRSGVVLPRVGEAAGR